MRTTIFKFSAKWSFLAGLSLFAAPQALQAQSWDDGLIAYEASQKEPATSAEDDIFAAMRALKEVEAIIEKPAQDAQVGGVAGEEVDINAILMAASNTEMPSLTLDSPETSKRSANDAAQEDVDSVKALAAIAAETPNKSESQKTAASLKKTSPKEVDASPKSEPEKVASANEKSSGQKADLALAEQTRSEAAPVKAPEAPDKSANKSETLAAAPKQSAAPKEVEKKYDVVSAPAKKAAPEQKSASAKDDKQPQKVTPKGDAVVAKNEKAPLTEAATASQKENETPKAAPKVEAPKTQPLAFRNASNATGDSVKKAPLGDAAVTPSALSMQYVVAVYSVNNVDLTRVANGRRPTISELYQYAFKKKLVYQNPRPAIGDLAFFHNSYDRNQDGRWNDWHTLVGLVEGIDGDSTISILVWMDDKIQRIKLNLKYPELHKGKKGQILNSQLRVNENGLTGTASKQFGGFANLLGNATQFTVIDNWQPGMKLPR